MKTMYENYKIFNQAKLACRLCPVGMVYDRVVSSDGDTINPVVMVIGEAPGREELISGKPFIGKSGRLLRDTLNSFGFRNDNTIITNVIPCRPQDNKFPKDDSIVNACMHRWLWEEIALLKPKHILLVGSKPLKFVLDMDGITSVRGHWFSLSSGLDTTCLATFHPSFVQRKAHMADGPDIMEKFKDDIKKVAIAARFIS